MGSEQSHICCSHFSVIIGQFYIFKAPSSDVFYSNTEHPLLTIPTISNG